MFRSGWSRLALVATALALAGFYVSQHLAISVLVGPGPAIIGILAIVAAALALLCVPLVFAGRWVWRGFRFQRPNKG